MPRKLVQRQFVVGNIPPSPPEARFVEAWRRIAADDALRAMLELPGRQLSDYFRERGRSALGRHVETANAWAEWAETVVLIAPHDAARRARALVRAVAHPYYNRLSHGGRGGRPALVVLEPTLDNDRLQGALDLCEAAHDRWAFAFVETTATVDVAQWFPERAADRFATIDEAALFAVSLVGADVVALLKGAVWFHERTKQEVATENDAVRLANFLAAQPTQLVVWHDALISMVQDFAEGFDPPLTISRGAEDAARCRLLEMSQARRLHLFSEVVRRDRLPSATDEQPPPLILSDDAAAGHAVPAPQTLVAAYDEVRAAESAAGTTSAEIRLTRLNDMAIGELCAWFDAAKLIVNQAETGSSP